MRTVTLRAETHGLDRRFLTASINDRGALLISGQDLGPSTAPVSSDGEYEWTHTIPPDRIPRLLAVLGAPESASILDVLEGEWTGKRSYELEKRIRDHDLASDTWTWGG